ncbi:hypothetical protein KFL_001050060 [Klebsormidium nitens]|uniref:DNA repair metallo-beta-lactamase domain-containing protein n=1 Tax=Klebsormidium nitens TaxID=105231 RepID=A0A1Y1HZ83_KLENI|nr:hypothetical protein KFL_001050060 [Klebsormidium nitens]|eukprot:GAQ82241.1 hypothetical protein KFL_001050060 [Klebsormidium nitens]
MARRDKPVNMPMWLPFTVDSWDRVSCHGKRHHFLTHAHTDHMAGLASFRTADRTIYCSRTTRDLVVCHFPQLGNAKFCYLEVDGGEMILEDEDKAFNISVRAFDANHCPGAIMLLFYVEDHGYVLHTGDARLAEARVVRPVKAFLRRRPLECLFMDCTYGDKAYGFPTKEDAVRQVCDVIARHSEDGQQVFLACDQLGMEEVLEGVFAKFGCGFWVDRSNASASARTWWDDLTFMHPEWLVNESKSTRFHLCDGRALGRRAEEAQRKAVETGGDPPVFIRPSSQFFVHGEDVPGDAEKARGMGLLPAVPPVWQQPVVARQDPFGIYRVLFSMHSSRSELMRAVEILAPRHVVHFVGEMGTELRTVVGRVSGGGLSSTWLGPVRRDLAPGRVPRADEGDPSADSEDEAAEGGSLKGSPSKSRGDSSGNEKMGAAGDEAEGMVTKGVLEGTLGREDVDPTPSLEKWDEFVPEAPPSPPMNFASSQGGVIWRARKGGGEGSRKDKAKGSLAKENIPPECDGLPDQSNCTSEVVEVTGLPPSARLKGGSAEIPGEASDRERNGTERNDGLREAALETEGRRKVGDGRREADITDGEDSFGRKRNRSGAFRAGQRECESHDANGGKSVDQGASQSQLVREGTATLGSDRCALKRKAPTVRSPARAIPKNGAIYRAFERQGVAQPIPLPHQRTRIRSYY